MSGDGLFSLPTVDFIYVHHGTIIKTSQIEYTSDDDGYPIHDPTTDIDVMGYAAPPKPSRSGRTEMVDTVFDVPNGTDVNVDDMVDIPPQDNLLPQLAGTYEINQVRPNPLHTRLLLVRAQSPEINSENVATGGDVDGGDSS